MNNNGRPVKVKDDYLLVVQASNVLARPPHHDRRLVLHQLPDLIHGAFHLFVPEVEARHRRADGLLLLPMPPPLLLNRRGKVLEDEVRRSMVDAPRGRGRNVRSMLRVPGALRVNSRRRR